MSDIKELLQKAATKVDDYQLAIKLEAAAESLAEPVAWVMLTSEGGIDWGEDCFSDCPDTGRAPLYLAPQPAVPEGRTESDYMDDYERGCVDGWNNCRETMLATTENNNVKS